MAIDTIQPQIDAMAPQAAPVAPAAPEAPATPDPAAAAPELANLPVVQAVIIGQPAAIYATEADRDNPSVAAIAQNARSLPQIGLSMFANDSVGVLFNPELITPQEVAQAVKNDTLDSIAIPLSMLEQAMNDVRAEDGGAAPAAGAAAGAAASPVPPAPAGTKRQINSARLQNLQPQAPTKGARAGQGLVNDLTRPVV